MKGGGLSRRYRDSNQRAGHSCVTRQIVLGKMNQEYSRCGTARSIRWPIVTGYGDGRRCASGIASGADFNR